MVLLLKAYLVRGSNFNADDALQHQRAGCTAVDASLGEGVTHQGLIIVSLF